MQRVVKRYGWGVIDQGVSSLTNFLVGALVARTLSAEQFGAFSIAFAIYGIILGLSRAATSEPLLVRAHELNDAAEQATGTALAIGFLFIPASAIIGLLVTGSVGLAIAVLGLCLPILLLHDAWRFVYIANDTPKSALKIDALWGVILVPVIIALAASGVGTAWPYLLAWGASAGLPSLLAVIMSATAPPQVRELKRWLSVHRDLIVPFAGEFVLLSLSSHGITIALGIFAGVAASGTFRAAQLILGPVTVMLMGLSTIAVPDMSRTWSSRPNELTRRLIMYTFIIASLPITWAIFSAFAIPNWLGTAMIGDAWIRAHPLILPLGVMLSLSAISGSPALGMRALQEAGSMLRLRFRTAPLVTTMGLAGTIFGGPLAAIVGLAGGHALSATWWWKSFINLRKERM